MLKWYLSIILLLTLAACAPYQYKPQPLDTEQLLITIQSWQIEDPQLKRFLLANGLSSQALEESEFSLKRLYLSGLYYDPQMQVAFQQWQKAKLTLQHSQYRLNPELAIPFEHHSDTSDNRSPWTIGAVLSFIYERRGKREARQAAAELAVFNARLKLLQIAQDKYAQMAAIYHDFIINKQRLYILDEEILLLEQLLAQAQTELELGATSRFEINSLNLELQQRLFDKQHQQNRLLQQREQLLVASHLAKTDFDGITIEFVEPLAYTLAVYADQPFASTEFSQLQSLLLAGHIGLARMLNDYAQAEAKLKLEIENQYPDIVLSPGFIFDQSDNIWTLGAAWILPLFENSKQNLAIIQALEDRNIQQREVLTMQKQLMDTLYQHHQSVQRQVNMMTVSDAFIGSAQSQIALLQQQLALGGINKTVLLRNQLLLTKARLNQLDVYQQALQSLQNLQDLLYPCPESMDIKSIIESWLSEFEEASLQ